MKAWIIAIAVGLVAISGRAARAQGDVCTPTCRSGYLCHQGTCISACNPVCGDTELCTDAGQCVSKCNPLCGANESCGADGQCRAAAVTPARVLGPPAMSGPPVDYTPMPASEGWAPLAGRLGITTAIITAGLVTAIIIVDDVDFSIPVGSVATVFAGVMVPVVARGAASARTNPSVTGAPGLRLTGWIFYGLALADAVTLLGLAASGADVPNEVTGSVGVIGAASAIFMSMDAFESASQARTPPASGFGARPYLGAVRDAKQQTVTTAGVAWNF